MPNLAVNISKEKKNEIQCYFLYGNFKMPENVRKFLNRKYTKLFMNDILENFLS